MKIITKCLVVNSRVFIWLTWNDAVCKSARGASVSIFATKTAHKESDDEPGRMSSILDSFFGMWGPGQTALGQVVNLCPDAFWFLPPPPRQSAPKKRIRTRWSGPKKLVEAPLKATITTAEENQQLYWLFVPLGFTDINLVVPVYELYLGIKITHLCIWLYDNDNLHKNNNSIQT